MFDSMKCDNCRYKFLLDREKELKLSKKNADLLIPAYARFMKLAAGRLEWKAEDYETKNKRKAHFGFELNKSDIKSLFILCGQLERYLEEITINPRTRTGLSAGFGFQDQYDALDYFEKNLSGKILVDSTGTKVSISKDRFCFMYKDPNENHTVADEFYVPQRGERIAYIIHVLTQSKCIFERPFKSKPENAVDRMYLMAFKEEWDNTPQIIYFAVITRKSTRKGATAEFITAFPISNANNLCKRVSGYRQIQIPKK